jgi:hypothetical protein
VGTPCVGQVDPSCDIGEFSLHEYLFLISWFFREVRLTFDLFGEDPRGIRLEESTSDETAPHGAGSVGDATGRGSSGGDRSGGKRGIDANDP